MTQYSSGRYTVAGLITTAVLVAGFGVWGVEAQLSGAVIATGVVEVEGHSQVVEHPEGGVVEAVLVREGDVVEAGSALVRLDGRVIASELAIIQGQLDEIDARSTRLIAERDNLAMKPARAEFAARLDKNPELQEIFEGQKRLYAARAETYKRTRFSLFEQQQQIRSEIEGQQAREEAFKQQLDLVIEELEGLESLLERGLTVKSQVLELRRSQAQLTGVYGEIQASIARNRGRIAQIDTELLRLESQRREQAVTELRNLSVNGAELTERKRAVLVRQERLELKAPISGVVHSLAVTAAKTVIHPDEPVLYVVPQDERFVIAARIDITHVDSVYPGQQAFLRFTAFQSRSTPELKGTLDRISPDVLVDESTGQQYYSAYLHVNPGQIELLEGRHLVPGMPVETYIETDARTPVAYLLQPLTDYFNRAFREG